MSKKILRILVSSAILVLVIFITSSLGARDSQSRGRLDRTSIGVPDQILPQAVSSPLWARTYGLFFGGSTSPYSYERDYPDVVQSIGNGRLVVAGSAASEETGGYPHVAAVIMALGPSGNVVWANLYPWDLNAPTQISVSALTQTPSGGLLAVGAYYDSSQNYALVMDLDQNGSTRWIKSYCLVSSSSNAAACAVARTSDAGYAVAARTDSGIWVFKLDQSGGVIWSSVFSIVDLDSVKGIQETSDGGLVIAGNCLSGGSTEWAWVIRLNTSGGLVWHTSLSSNPALRHNYTGVTSIVATRDGGLALAGHVQPPGTFDVLAWACKLNGAGQVSWSKTYNGQETSSILQTSDGGLLLLGGYPARAFKLSSSGTVQWAKRYERSLKAVFMQAGIEKRNGGYIMAATSGTIKLAPSFDYTPWNVMSVDKNGNIGSGCPFVRSMTGDARNVTVQKVSYTLSVISLNYRVRTVAFGSQVPPSVRVGLDVCGQIKVTGYQ